MSIPTIISARKVTEENFLKEDKKESREPIKLEEMVKLIDKADVLFKELEPNLPNKLRESIIDMFEHFYFLYKFLKVKVEKEDYELIKKLILRLQERIIKKLILKLEEKKQELGK